MDSRAVLRRKGEACAPGSTPGCRAQLRHKDLGSVTSTARQAGVVIPAGPWPPASYLRCRPGTKGARATARCSLSPRNCPDGGPAT